MNINSEIPKHKLSNIINNEIDIVLSSLPRHKYTGSEIHKRFAYEKFRDNVNPLGDIYVFRGPMEVTDNLIDLEDSLEQDFIYSDEALQCIWEIPNCSPMAAVCFQRLFINVIASFIRERCPNEDIKVDGDDILLLSNDLVTYKKVSVSITKSTDNVALGHIGLNIRAGNKAPDFAGNLPTEVVSELEIYLRTTFYYLVNDLFIATTKVV